MSVNKPPLRGKIELKPTDDPEAFRATLHLYDAAGVWAGSAGPPKCAFKSKAEAVTYFRDMTTKNPQIFGEVVIDD